MLSRESQFDIVYDDFIAVLSAQLDTEPFFWFQGPHMILNTILYVYYRASFNCNFMLYCMKNQI